MGRSWLRHAVPVRICRVYLANYCTKLRNQQLQSLLNDKRKQVEDKMQPVESQLSSTSRHMDDLGSDLESKQEMYFYLQTEFRQVRSAEASNSMQQSEQAASHEPVQPRATGDASLS